MREKDRPKKEKLSEQCEWDGEVIREGPVAVDMIATGRVLTWRPDLVNPTTMYATVPVEELKYCRFDDEWPLKRRSQCSLDGR